ncbi:hypothetical protein ODS41_10030 [Pyrobaculum sp. 3827-6]|uniref:hypothetical protein n=1 Tax=Pyrobaculum sp. 3827-6 TaxID=2983604 RepID=UPI0021D951EF|nr:hypothetical protein [Pyrobaculum sp. 3827-6]MCU7788248.1 hypothetical protein [Pyrobaculum sp. 3827-6]
MTKPVIKAYSAIAVYDLPEPFGPMNIVNGLTEMSAEATGPKYLSDKAIRTSKDRTKFNSFVHRRS